jgi:[ribosomal protein S5]-alanine N-acetyltransferase
MGAVERPMIRGERIWLRPFEEADLRPYRDFANSAEGQIAGFSLPMSEESARSWYASIQKKQGQDGYFFVISPLGSEEFVGSIWLWNIGGRLQGAELSMFIAERDRWGRGIGTDAINAALDFAFGHRDLHRVWLFTDAPNERAQRAFEKAGFAREGTLRRHIRRNGHLIDSVLMAILREEWEALDRKRSWDYAG